MFSLPSAFKEVRISSNRKWTLPEVYRAKNLQHCQRSTRRNRGNLAPLDASFSSKLPTTNLSALSG